MVKNNNFQLVIFGVAGDLSRRKLLPALGKLILEGKISSQIQIVGVERQKISIDALLDSAKQFFDQEDAELACAKLAQVMSVFSMDLKNPAQYQKLKDHLDASKKPNTERLFHFSTPADIFQDIILGLGKSGLNLPAESSNKLPRILIEKPFGEDLKSAQALADIIKKYFQEEQVYLIDHYLFKESVRNILNLRFKNPIFQSLWQTKLIESVKISIYEDFGISNRIEFYEKTGALKDMVQNHLLELLTIAIMERPANWNQAAIHQAKLELLNSITPVAHDQATRGQYYGYREEVGNPQSTTETFVRLNLNSHDARWSQTKMTIEVGKALDDRRTEIELVTKTLNGDENKNIITFHLQPLVAVDVGLWSKKPDSHELASFNLQTEPLKYPSTDYESVFLDAARGDQSFFVPIEEALALWRIIDPLIEYWKQDDRDLLFYEQGVKAERIVR